jgi:PAS domain S-box-containing protein
MSESSFGERSGILRALAEGNSDLKVCQQFGLLIGDLERILADLATEASSSPELALQWAEIRAIRAENARIATEGRLQALMDISPEAVLVVNAPTGAIERANDLASTMFGYPASELIGLSIEELVPDQYRHIHPVFRIRFMTSTRKREMGYHPPIFAKRKDGSEVEVAIALTANPTDDTVMVVCTEFARWNRLVASGEDSATNG